METISSPCLEKFIWESRIKLNVVSLDFNNKEISWGKISQSKGGHQIPRSFLKSKEKSGKNILLQTDLDSIHPSFKRKIMGEKNILIQMKLHSLDSFLTRRSSLFPTSSLPS